MQCHILACLLIVCAASLVSADTLLGAVKDADGTPIVGARVDVSTAAPKSGPGLFCPSCYLDCAKSTKTDEQGRFEFTGLDPTLKFRLLATAPDMQTAVTDLLDPAQDTASITLLSFPSDTPEDRVLRGEVVSTEGVPISGALVYPCGAKTSKRRWGGRVDGAKAVVTDDDGRFRMLLTEDFVAVDVEVTAHGYPGATAEQLRLGEDSHTITVPFGTSVTGRLTFRGRPRADRPIAVVQVNRGRHDRIFIKAVLGTTNDAGRFEFNALPADEPYAIFTPVGSGVTGPVLATTLFNAMADGATHDIGELQLRPGLTIAGHLQMTDDTEIPDGVRLTLGRMPAWDLIEVPVDTAGSFRIENLPPETYELSLRGANILLDERQLPYQILGRTTFGLRLTRSCVDLVIPIRQWQEGDAPLRGQYRRSGEVSGNQTLSGQVVDRDGSPVGGIRVEPRFLHGGFIRLRQAVPKSDADGRFTIRNLPDERIELTFSDRSAFGYPSGITSSGEAGRMVLYPGFVWPQLNQSDIRMVFDPELTTPPLDLR